MVLHDDVGIAVVHDGIDARILAFIHFLFLPGRFLFALEIAKVGRKAIGCHPHETLNRRRKGDAFRVVAYGKALGQIPAKRQVGIRRQARKESPLVLVAEAEDLVEVARGRAFAVHRKEEAGPGGQNHLADARGLAVVDDDRRENHRPKGVALVEGRPLFLPDCFLFLFHAKPPIE